MQILGRRTLEERAEERFERVPQRPEDDYVQDEAETGEETVSVCEAANEGRNNSRVAQTEQLPQAELEVHVEAADAEEQE